MEEQIGRAKAIRLKCLDCCCGNSAEVRRCDLRKCPLWRYRMGNKNKAEIMQKSADFQPNDSGV